MHSPNEADLDNLLDQAWRNYQDGDKAALDNIYELLMPFCLRVSSKTCGRYIGNDEEEASIARMAVVETLEKYNPQRGSFLLFLGRVIRNRIIDYKRQEKRRRIIPFSFLDNKNLLMDEVDEGFFEEIIDDLARKQEILKLKSLLQEFNISFEDLVNFSPRQNKTRDTAQKIALIIAENEDLRRHLLDKKLLPMRDLENKWKVDRKVADRYRKFIITATLIQWYEFPYLKSYVLPAKGVNKNGF
jgi:RNA polymerase sigma factor